jgi:mannose-6-phosphate isomerase
MDRVWGGRNLETRLRRKLPPGRPIGESWELVDREDVQSVVNHGDLMGATLNDLWMNMREMVFGEGLPDSPRFPLLAKILDARDTLSVQVHPPASKAAALKGEPKTEMWYLLDADPDAAIYAGFKCHVTREAFEDALSTGDVEPLLYKIPVNAGDAMFIPSGRCHAIGAGCFIIEIQQNSDTTYRVFDWNRTGLDGKPRDLHIAESLESIEFNDHEPWLAPPSGEAVVECPLFNVERWSLAVPRADESTRGALFTVLSGEVVCAGRAFRRGDFFLLPAIAEDRALVAAEPNTSVLRTTIPVAD